MPQSLSRYISLPASQASSILVFKFRSFRLCLVEIESYWSSRVQVLRQKEYSYDDIYATWRWVERSAPLCQCHSYSIFSQCSCTARPHCCETDNPGRAVSAAALAVCFCGKDHRIASFTAATDMSSWFVLYRFPFIQRRAERKRLTFQEMLEVVLCSRLLCTTK